MTLVQQTHEILATARSVLDTPETSAEIDRLSARLDAPLRVAIAGKVKAGKSTLLNALVGELLAPTDTGECTKVVTWYVDGHTYQVMLYPANGGTPVQARFNRDDGAIDIDLGGRNAADVDRLEVTWPSGGLRELTLIDTPGVDSLNESIATKAYEFLDPDEDDTPADAVLYLMKHIHAADLRLLEAFHDDSMAAPSPVNAIAVLSRADEIGVGRPNSMDSANRIAVRLGDDPRLRRLVQMIVPVAGLLAETAGTMTESEYRELCELAALGADELEMLLLSADRFVEARPETPLTSLDRARLVGRFGLFGIRSATALLSAGTVTSSRQLAEQLTRLSGLDELRGVLSTLFVARADVLKARSGLLAVERLCREHRGAPGVESLEAELERVMASAHPFNEMNTLAAIRSGWVTGPAARVAELERILGTTGTLPAQRLGLAVTASVDEIRHTSIAEIARLQRIAENPLTTLDLATAIRVAIRSLEGIVAETS